ncbi:Cgi121p [Cyberlindnera jadinii NRRL Y-1542]|uniref:EKC/KEOPS complex subunit CGI121 n=1 Tax=Cyberlindnera jadinii (strain ATCC 18201 / CBS 1600 / BCRC 20928 / JCM 3617 / NBRC 0987 / NRRL Y-1542) TaxID=983966 RepID=A0A1E4S255_CYBJN|nr:EKC/KEOPS complex subunit Cgi121 [Cyberlindnera jadinii NRRL Y-1542]ODV73587.1 EKC/KEOPS complex subunit Cgi121 [Cyberlindnera jadinii NRRL Y-1542]
MSIKTVLPQFPQFTVHLFKFKNVTNSKEIKQNLIKGDKRYDFSFINAQTVLSEEQLLSAVYRALLDHTQDKIRTKTIHSEVIFSLSPTQNIMDALRRFGIQDDSTDLIVIKIVDSNSQEEFDLSVVEGEEVDITDEDLKSSAILKTIKKNYKLKSEDLTVLSHQIVAAIQLRGL